MGKVVKSAMILFIITLISGFLLGAVHEITKLPIAEAQEKREQESYKKVFSEASDFQVVENFDKKQAAEILTEAGYEKDTIGKAIEAEASDGSSIGYILDITSKEGYGGEIEFQLGIRNGGSVTGIEILSISETAGLGMKATTSAFRDQYTDKKVDTFSVTKTGAADDSEINAISGATITSRAMTNGVNAGLLYYREVLGGESGE